MTKNYDNIFCAFEYDYGYVCQIFSIYILQTLFVLDQML